MLLELPRDEKAPRDVQFLVLAVPGERDELHPIVIKPHVDVARREAGNRRGWQWFHLPRPDIALSRPPPDARMYERQSHVITADYHCRAGVFRPRRLGRSAFT